MVFQDPYESINPRFTVSETLSEPIKVQRLAQRGQSFLLPLTHWKGLASGLPRRTAISFPMSLVGGKGRGSPLREAIVMRPKFLVADEPVSMLDVSSRQAF